MTIKSAQILVADALSEIKTITPSEALEMSNKNECNLIDIRDASELQALGKIENSVNIPRGLLEFSIHPESAFVQNNNLDLNKETCIELNIKNILDGLEIDYFQFRDLCIMCGTDYNKNIYGIGPEKAFKLITMDLQYLKLLYY